MSFATRAVATTDATGPATFAAFEPSVPSLATFGLAASRVSVASASVPAILSAAAVLAAPASLASLPLWATVPGVVGFANSFNPGLIPYL